jgi:hypothetical protein
MQATAEPMPIVGLGMNLTQAREIYRQGEEAVVFALLQWAKLAGETPAGPTPPAVSPDTISPGTPSGMRPIDTKPQAPTRRLWPGRKDGQAAVLHADETGRRANRSLKEILGYPLCGDFREQLAAG